MLSVVSKIIILLLVTSTARADLIDDIDSDTFQPPPTKKPATSTPYQKPAAKKSISQNSETVYQSSQQDCQVYFKSKSLSALKQEGIIELHDNVVVKKCDLEIRSKKAVIQLLPGTDEVKLVKATGNVKISNYEKLNQKNITANGYEAVFEAAKNLVTLKGEPAKLNRSGDLFHGEQIRYDVSSGWIRASDVKGVVNKGSD